MNPNEPAGTSHYCDKRRPATAQEKLRISHTPGHDPLCLAEMKIIDGYWVCPRHGPIYKLSP